MDVTEANGEAPRIGITTYGRDERDWFELPAAYVDSVRRAGGVALLMPPGETRIDAWLESVDALVLAGGGDLDPECYGGARPESTYMTDGERDATELALMRALLEAELPTLCICRGLQVLNVALGGTLIEDIPGELGEAVVHRLPPREPTSHPVQVNGDSLVASVMGAREVVSASWHHQAIRELGKGLEVVGRAPDGVIEAVELSSHPWLVAVQWHPELSSESDPTQQRIFDALVEEAVENRTRRNACASRTGSR